MPFQFVFGPAGSGKSKYLYQETIRRSMEHPKQNFMVVVPEQFTMQTQKDLVSLHPSRGIMNIDVLSFARLAYRIFQENGTKQLPVLDDEGKNLILRKIASQCEEKLSLLKGNVRKLGYISEVKSVISELTQYDIHLEDMDRMMERVGNDKRLYYKLKDIRLLYQEFQEYLDEKFITKEELLDVLGREVPKSELLKNSTIILDGFTGFTPVQIRLIGELMENCREILISVTMDDREDPYRCQHPYQLFAISKQMVTSLVEVARERKVEILEPVYFYEKPVYRFADNPAMAFLERNIFRYGKEVFQGKQDAITLHVARNPKEETKALAGLIRRMVRTQGYRYREIGVIVSDMDVYGEELKRAFWEYDIPVFMDYKRSILLNPFVEFLRSILNIAEQNFSYDSVFRALKTGIIKMDRSQTDALENYCIQMGVRGYKKWNEPWIRKTSEMSLEDLEAMNQSRLFIMDQLQAVFRVLKKRKKTVREITVALYELMVAQEYEERLKEWENHFAQIGELTLSREYAQIYKVLIELFEKFVDLLGEENVTVKEYEELLEAGLVEAKVGVIPPGTDQVVAGDVERTRLKDIRALMFLGADDSRLPGNLLRNGLLSERDRKEFEKEKISLAPGGKERTYIQKFYLYLNLNKPSEKLDIFYSKVSNDGKNVRESYLIQEMKKLYKEIEIVDEEQRPFLEKENIPKLAVSELIRGFSDAGVREKDVWKQLYCWYKTNPEWKQKVDVLLHAGRYHRPKDEISREIANQLYGEEFRDSISRMEKFSACAFSHFLTYGLHLKERELYEFAAIDFGNICHLVLEKYAKELEKQKMKWSEVSSRQQKEILWDCLMAAITDYGDSVLYDSARNEAMITRMKSILFRTVWALTSQLSCGDFEPYKNEVRFYSGKIDRIDACEDEDAVYLKVIDYKTGKKAFDIVSLYHGLQLQLMVYMDAAVKMGQIDFPDKEVIPAGVFYYRVDDPLIQSDEMLNPIEEERNYNVDQLFLKELRPDGLVNLSGNSCLHLDRNMTGESLAVPIRFNKDGSLSKTSKAVSAEDFDILMAYAVKKVKEVHERIANGETKVYPYRKGNETACDYCDYRHICGFDVRIPGYQYHEIESMPKETVIQKMKGELNR